MQEASLLASSFTQFAEGTSDLQHSVQYWMAIKYYAQNFSCCAFFPPYPRSKVTFKFLMFEVQLLELGSICYRGSH